MGKLIKQGLDFSIKSRVQQDKNKHLHHFSIVLLICIEQIVNTLKLSANKSDKAQWTKDLISI